MAQRVALQRLKRASTVNLHCPTDVTGGSAQRFLTLPPREALCTPTAQGNGSCQERGAAHGDTAEPLRRARHIGVELYVKPGIYGAGHLVTTNFGQRPNREMNIFLRRS